MTKAVLVKNRQHKCSLNVGDNPTSVTRLWPLYPLQTLTVRHRGAEEMQGGSQQQPSVAAASQQAQARAFGYISFHSAVGASPFAGLHLLTRKGPQC